LDSNFSVGDLTTTLVVEPLPEEDFDENIEYFIPWVNEEIHRKHFGMMSPLELLHCCS
jgi:hypothetical protein